MPTLKTITHEVSNEIANHQISEIIEEYCEAIHNLSLEAQGGLVKAVRLAERMKVTGPTVFTTLQRMHRDGLVVIDERTRAVRLTEQGEEIAIKLTRRHNLLERFLVDHLGLEWEIVHDEACRLEHAMSPLVEAALDKFLGYPTTCPHGNPIPGSSFVAQAQSERLSQVAPGQTITIERISEEAEHEPGLLALLKQQGIVPEAVFYLKEFSPFQDLLLLTNANGREIGLGSKTAHKIWVTITPPNEA
jgi:DtxR family Mn-dependent transcriptional regulator